MPTYGPKSQAVYNTLHPIWQEILTDAIKCAYFDHSLIEGYRTGADQDVMYDAGLSHARAGESAHNTVDDNGEPCSMGVDLIPYPSGYSDGKAMLLLAGHIISRAERLGYKVTSGADWNRNGLVIDTTFRDFWHLQLTNWKIMAGK